MSISIETRKRYHLVIDFLINVTLGMSGYRDCWQATLWCFPKGCRRLIHRRRRRFFLSCNSITRLDATLTAQGKDLAEIDKTVQNHETRITVLEQK